MLILIGYSLIVMVLCFVALFSILKYYAEEKEIERLKVALSFILMGLLSIIMRKITGESSFEAVSIVSFVSLGFLVLSEYDVLKRKALKTKGKK